MLPLLTAFLAQLSCHAPFSNTPGRQGVRVFGAVTFNLQQLVRVVRHVAGVAGKAAGRLAQQEQKRKVGKYLTANARTFYPRWNTEWFPVCVCVHPLCFTTFNQIV